MWAVAMKRSKPRHSSLLGAHGFQGHRKRKAFHIINRLKPWAVNWMAFTDKEKICLCFFARWVLRAGVRVADRYNIQCRFPQESTERERKVILERWACALMILMEPCKTSSMPCYPRHSMGMNILGREETVNNFSRRHFQEFIARHMDTNRVIFSVVGNLPGRKWLNWPINIWAKCARDVRASSANRSNF